MILLLTFVSTLASVEGESVWIDFSIHRWPHYSYTLIKLSKFGRRFCKFLKVWDIMYCRTSLKVY